VNLYHHSQVALQTVANLDPVVRYNGRVNSAAFYREYGEQQTKETGENINQYFTKS
jgi:hypothetical protein